MLFINLFKYQAFILDNPTWIKFPPALSCSSWSGRL